MMLVLIQTILLLCISSIFCSLDQFKFRDNHDSIWCNHCGMSIGKPSKLFYKKSPGALKEDYREMFGKNVTVQTLVNPFHFMFDVVTIEEASCADRGHNTRGDSWFPGYSWRICTCPSCATQLGWTFEKALTNDIDDTNQNQTFHALILGQVHPLYVGIGISLNPPALSVNTSIPIASLKQSTISETTTRSSTSVISTSVYTPVSLIQPRASDNQLTTEAPIANSTYNASESVIIPNNNTNTLPVSSTNTGTAPKGLVILINATTSPKA